MSALAVVVLLALTADSGSDNSTSSAPATYRLTVGGQLGFPHLVGVTAMAGILRDGKRRFDVDVLWEPSLQAQSYSVGGAYHVLDSPFFLGVRARLLQFAPSWQRGGGDAWLGLGAELGGRFQVLQDKGLIHLALFATWVPAQATNLQLLLGLSAGFSWEVLRR